MKKIMFIFISVLLLFSLSACDNSDKKMDGFTPEELAEYLSSIDGITPIGINSGKTIECNDFTIRSSNYDHMKAAVGYYTFNMKDYFILLVPDEDNLYGSPNIVTNLFETVGPIQAYFYDELKAAKNQYLGIYPNNFAYIIRDCGFSSSPDWTEWIDYEIPIDHQYMLSHGEWNQYWYNPINEDFEVGHYYRELENSTEIYVVYQDISLFIYIAYQTPLLMSEEMYEHLKETYKKFRYEDYQKGTVKEFSEWFMGEYTEDIPSVFSDIKAEYVYYPAYGRGIYADFDADDYDAVAWFIQDMEKLGVNFDELRSYVIKATVPHDGTIQDIFWELIG